MTQSENEQVQQRTPEPPVVLEEVGSGLLQEAADNGSGTAALTLTPSLHGTVKQTVVAVRSGATLSPGHWNGPTSLHVLRGRAQVSGIDDELPAGSWLVVPDPEADVQAGEDLVALVTVVNEGGATEGA